MNGKKCKTLEVSEAKQDHMLNPDLLSSTSKGNRIQASSSMECQLSCKKPSVCWEINVLLLSGRLIVIQHQTSQKTLFLPKHHENPKITSNPLSLSQNHTGANSHFKGELVIHRFLHGIQPETRLSARYDFPEPTLNLIILLGIIMIKFNYEEKFKIPMVTSRIDNPCIERDCKRVG